MHSSRPMTIFLTAVASGLALAWAAAPPKSATPTLPQGKSHALILVGLPGDGEHEKQFATIARQWRDWLTDSLGFASRDVRVLFGRNGKPGLARGAARRGEI